jgi:hypothetical protein
MNEPMLVQQVAESKSTHFACRVNAHSETQSKFDRLSVKISLHFRMSPTHYAGLSLSVL